MKLWIITILYASLFLGCKAALPINNQAEGDKTVIQINPLKNDSKEYPIILGGQFFLHDARRNLQMSLDLFPKKEDVIYTTSRGISVNLPSVKTTFEMDIMNCNEYLGTAKVTYHGLDVWEVWTAEIIPETQVSDLEKKMLKCVDTPNDEFTRKYLSNIVFFISPKNENRKLFKNIIKPNWKEVVSTIPYEWRKIAKLPMFPSDKQAKECIENWLDSDGDGVIDILTLCAINEESGTENGSSWRYLRYLQLVNGQWRQIWQTVDTKD